MRNEILDPLSAAPAILPAQLLLNELPSSTTILAPSVIISKARFPLLHCHPLCCSPIASLRSMILGSCHPGILFSISKPRATSRFSVGDSITPFRLLACHHRLLTIYHAIHERSYLTNRSGKSRTFRRHLFPKSWCNLLWAPQQKAEALHPRNLKNSEA